MLEQAIETFVRGFCFTRSFTHPYVPTRIGPLWVMRDGPRRNGTTRTEEWIVNAQGMVPEEIDHLVRQHARDRFAICAILPHGHADDVLRAGFKACGYRLVTTETLMVHPLRRAPQEIAAPSGVELHRVTTPTLAGQLNRAARARQILPDHLTSDGRAPLRAYVALNDDRVIGWVRSIPVGSSTWVSNMYVAPAWRRRGIGRGLLGTMLHDDRAAGARTSVLLASHSGARLYPVVGYESIGMLYLFKRRRSS